VVHANEFGEQILAKIMMAFWTAPDHPESVWLPQRLEWFENRASSPPNTTMDSAGSTHHQHQQ
jgi:hypothetical protein